MNFTSSSFSSSRILAAFLLLQLLLVQPCLLHPQPCHLLAQIGHSVRVGALLPAQRAARVQVQAALNRAAAALSRDRDRDNFLPYNLSLELVSRQPAAADPESLFRCVCQGVVVQGVTAVLAFPQSREELLQVDFMASFLEIPFISVIEHEEPLDTQVSVYTRGWARTTTRERERRRRRREEEEVEKRGGGGRAERRKRREEEEVEKRGGGGEERRRWRGGRRE
ncbi:hypothetical protein PAMA_001094 [Pampus argenteus]